MTISLTRAATFAHLLRRPVAAPAAVTPRAEEGAGESAEERASRLEDELRGARQRADEAERRCAEQDQELKRLKAEDDGGDDDADAETGDQMPPDNDADPDKPAPEPVPARGDAEEDDEDPDDDDEDREDDRLDKEPDEEMRRAKRAQLRARRRAKARRAERARCAKIFGTKAAAKNVGLAAELAFNTTLSARRAVAVLDRGGAAGGLGARMADLGVQLGVVGSGAGSPAGPPANAIATSWDGAMKKARTW